MNKSSISFLLIILAVLLLTRCSNDVDLYADYKEITIVYGLMDVSDDTTFIKIAKAFTGPGNALIMAQDPDSSNYPFKLDAKLMGKKNGADLEPIVLDTVTIYNKQEGDSVFYYPKQLMYYTTEPLDVNAVYTLAINTGKNEVSAVSPLIGNLTVSYPYNTIDFMNDHAVKWSSVKNGKRYEVKAIFNYREFLPGTYEDTLNLSFPLETIFSSSVKVSSNTDGGEDLELIYTGESFFNELNAKLEVVPNIERWAGNVDVIVTAGSEVLHYYIEINHALAGSLVQEIPNYTNINNGIGIFASRHSVIKSVSLSGYTERTLIEDYNLGFKHSSK
jgi:hypothetical protein